MSLHADTPVDRTDLDAYNGTFWDLGFRWSWDAETYRELCALPEEKERIRRYIDRHQPHLLKAYDCDFLASLILESKARRQSAASPVGIGTVVELA